MISFRTAFQGERLVLRVPYTDAAEDLAYYLCLAGLEPMVEAGPKDRVLDLSRPPSSLSREPDALPSLILDAIHGLAVLLKDRFLFLHACGFCFHGKAVLVCGPSGSGKTTMAMVAEHLGYAALGEDLVTIDWQTGRVHALAMPFRPRPFTREFLNRWYVRRGGSWERDAPIRPQTTSGSFPLVTTILAGVSEDTAPEALLASAFGRAHLDPTSLLKRITRALLACKVLRCPRIRIQPDLSESQLTQVMEQWLNRPETPCPKEIFGDRS